MTLGRKNSFPSIICIYITFGHLYPIDMTLIEKWVAVQFEW